MNNRYRFLCLFCLLLLTLVAAPAPAQSDEAQPETARQAAAPAENDESEMTRKERKAAAKEQRIQEYLRKREQRQARKAAEKEAREQARLDARTTDDAAEATAQAEQIEAEQIRARQKAARPQPQPAPEPVATVDDRAEKKKGKKRGRGPQVSPLPRDLARAQQNVRSTHLAADPTVQEYLELIDRQGASPHQLAAFGSFLAQSGMTRDALEYYNVAIRIDAEDPTLWVNRGTLQMQARDYNAAASSFAKALSLNPNHSVAHYNLGASLDEMNRYDDAVASYKTALTLDPSLGDPVKNPQAANNDLLLAVRLMLYQETDGSLSTPLLDVDTGQLPRAFEQGEIDE
jgi:tetratricopeptide (TPR) repeat protein